MASAKLLSLRPQSRIIDTLRKKSKDLEKVPKVDPRERYVALFPSSDNVFVGMGLGLLNSAPAEQVFMDANEQLNRNIFKLCLDGPKAALLDTLEARNLAAFVTSHAIIKKLEADDEYKVKFCKTSGGIGVGFINSLVLGGSMTFSDALDLVQKQAQAMDKMIAIAPNAKVRIRLRPATKKHKVCRAAVEHCLSLDIPPELAVCSVTKFISPHIIEIGGHEEAIRYLETEGLRLFEFSKIHRVVGNSKAYNTMLMEPASEYIRQYIQSKVRANSDYIKEPLACSAHSATAGYRMRNTKQIIKDICDYPIKPIKMENLLNGLYRRPAEVPMPNTLILWDWKLPDWVRRYANKNQGDQEVSLDLSFTETIEAFSQPFNKLFTEECLKVHKLTYHQSGDYIRICEFASIQSKEANLFVDNCYLQSKKRFEEIIRSFSSSRALILFKHIKRISSSTLFVMDDESNSSKTSVESQRTIVRTIDHLPLPSFTDYTPHTKLEFDQSVQEYCQNRANHQLRKFSDNSKLKQSSYGSLINGQIGKAIARSCKLVLSGDVAVGKTCLVNRFGRNTYSNNYQTTIGVDFDIQKFNIMGQSLLLQVWDTAGLERSKCITSSYYRGCQAALLLFDMSNLSTLANVIKWKDEVLNSSKTFDQLSNETLPGQKNLNSIPLLFLVGTKTDLPVSEPSRQFIKEQANKIAQLLQAELWFVSAQTGQNVTELFNRVAALIFNRCIQNEIQKIKFETSTLGACIKEKILQQQRELWHQSSKLIKITKKKDGDDRRSRCINVQCVIK